MLADTEKGTVLLLRDRRPGRPANPAAEANYELQPLPIKAGETVKDSVDLHELYKLGDLGTFRATASIYLASAGKWFTSKPDAFDVTDGRLLGARPSASPIARRTRR